MDMKVVDYSTLLNILIQDTRLSLIVSLHQKGDPQQGSQTSAVSSGGGTREGGTHTE